MVAIASGWEPVAVLLVDDEPLVRQIVARLLRLEGCEVTEAAAGADAIQWLEQGKVDLLLTDVMMPDMNGCELGREVSARWPGLHVLYYSGHVFESLFQSGICPRDIPFIKKPFGAEDLRRRIQETMEASPYRFQ